MKYLLSLLIGFEILDGFLTHHLVGNGLGKEANPILQDLVLRDNFLSLKICGGILAIFLLWNVYKRWPKMALVCTSFFVVFYTVVVAWNFSLCLV